MLVIRVFCCTAVEVLTLLIEFLISSMANYHRSQSSSVFFNQSKTSQVRHLNVWNSGLFLIHSPFMLLVAFVIVKYLPVVLIFLFLCSLLLTCVLFLVTYFVFCILCDFFFHKFYFLMLFSESFVRHKFQGIKKNLKFQMDIIVPHMYLGLVKWHMVDQ